MSQLRDTESKDEKVNPRMRPCGIQNPWYFEHKVVTYPNHTTMNIIVAPIMQTYKKHKKYAGKCIHIHKKGKRVPSTQLFQCILNL